jgi:hypothetical protein
MKQATDQVSQTFDFYALTVPERFQFGADAATIISGLIAIVAIGWAVRSHRTVLREQARLRAQELIISIAQSWNGNEMLPVRIEASQWLSDFPDDVDPIQWLADQGGDWTKIAVIAHFLVSVEYLVQDGQIDEALAVRHIGGGGWWLANLCICISDFRANIGWSRRLTLCVHGTQRSKPPQSCQLRRDLTTQHKTRHSVFL